MVQAHKSLLRNVNSGMLVVYVVRKKLLTDPLGLARSHTHPSFTMNLLGRASRVHNDVVCARLLGCFLQYSSTKSLEKGSTALALCVPVVSPPSP